jgi:tetratricopeptide (TPR) repeat protein
MMLVSKNMGRTGSAERRGNGLVQTPEGLLQRAASARSSGTRAKYATRGLAVADGDPETRLLLLRQLYLAHFEARDFGAALGVARDMVNLAVMADVALQDAARAHLALGDRAAAVRQLRLAARAGPASRRAFHLWTVGTVLYFGGEAREAERVLVRAARWATHDKPLYLAQAELARRALGERQDDLGALAHQLAEAPCGQGYGQFVRGELHWLAGEHDEARRLFRAFVKRTGAGRIALAVALASELTHARARLRELSHRRRYAEH